MSDEEQLRKFKNRRVIGISMLAAYVVCTAVTMGLRPEHVIIAGAFALLFGVNQRTQQFALLTLPFLLVGMAYDNLRLFIHLRGDVHVADLYAADVAWFGVDNQALPNWFQAHTHWLADLICGFAYLTYLLESFIFAAILFFKDKALLKRLAWAFALANLMGLITYVAYPAAPPWYVADYGLGPAIADALPSAAGALRFDALFGITVFEQMYSRNANVFGAMPSLHCAYPTVCALVAAKIGPKWWVPAVTFAVLMAISAVYLGHHYVLDVIAGVVYGFVAFGVTVAVQTWRKR